MSRHSAQDRRGPDLGLGVLRANCNEPKAPGPLLAPASSKPLCLESLRWCLSCLCFPQPGCRALVRGLGSWAFLRRPLLCTHISRNAAFPEFRLSQAVSNLT